MKFVLLFIFIVFSNSCADQDDYEIELQEDFPIAEISSLFVSGDTILITDKISGGIYLFDRADGALMKSYFPSFHDSDSLYYIYQNEEFKKQKDIIDEYLEKYSPGLKYASNYEILEIRGTSDTNLLDKNIQNNYFYTYFLGDQFLSFGNFVLNSIYRDQSGEYTRWRKNHIGVIILFDKGHRSFTTFNPLMVDSTYYAASQFGVKYHNTNKVVSAKLTYGHIGKSSISDFIQIGLFDLEGNYLHPLFRLNEDEVQQYFKKLSAPIFGNDKIKAVVETTPIVIEMGINKFVVAYQESNVFISCQKINGKYEKEIIKFDKLEDIGESRIQNDQKKRNIIINGFSKNDSTVVLHVTELDGNRNKILWHIEYNINTGKRLKTIDIPRKYGSKGVICSKYSCVDDTTILILRDNDGVYYREVRL
jgi:hypothetical protein